MPTEWRLAAVFTGVVAAACAARRRAREQRIAPMTIEGMPISHLCPTDTHLRHEASDHSLIAGGRFRAEADIHARVASTASVVNDPKRSWAGLKSRSAAVSCHRGVLSFRSEVPEAPTALRLDS
jgi:hypothetical protein